jgi:hypothetical protein
MAKSIAWNSKNSCMTQIENSLIILRFHYGNRGSSNPIISSTMGRAAVINHAYQGKMPQPYTLWLCRIDREISKNKERGCFVVTPVREIAPEKVLRLVPGTYDLEIQNYNVICRPKIEGYYWIAPSSIKKLYIKSGRAEILYQSVIVPLKIIEGLPELSGYKTEAEEADELPKD